MYKAKRAFLTRPLFYLFLTFSVVSFITCECILSFYKDDTEYILEAQGEVYREAWNDKNTFVLKTENKREKKRILINCKNLSKGYVENLLKTGVVSFKGVVSIPGITGNFSEFDYLKYLKSHNIEGVAYPTETEITTEGAIQCRPKYGFYAMRVRNDIESCLTDCLGEEYSSWTMSVMTGYTGGLESSEKKNLSFAGLSHLVAVSGAHIGFFTLPFEFAMKKSALGKQYKKAVLLLPVLILWFIAGNSPSVIRAVIMAFISSFACILRKPYDVLNSLGFSGLIQLLVNPFCVYSTGFLLSYAAVISLNVLLPVLKKKIRIKSKMIDSFLSGVAVNMGIIPVLLYLFNGFSVIGVLVNVAASWVAGFLCISGYLVYFCTKMLVPKGIVLVLSKAIIGATELFIETTEQIAESESVLMRFKSVSPSLCFFAAYYGALILLMFGKKYIYGSGALLACATLLWLLSLPVKVEFVFFDVGQGSAALVKTCDGVAGLIDTGDGNVNLSNLLMKEGVKRLDFILISHGHDDHYGGLEEVVENIEVERVFVPSNTYDTYCMNLQKRINTKVVFIEDYAEYKLGNYSKLNMYESPSDQSNINNGSVIAKISGDWGSVLLPGDSENDVLEFFTSAGVIKDVDILCFPHHGASSADSKKFLFSAMPEYVIISAGKDNQYGHPSQSALEHLALSGVSEKHIYRTDEYGAVRVRAGNFSHRIGEFIYIWQKKMKLLPVLQT